jgi:hypothetical protein
MGSGFQAEIGPRHAGTGCTDPTLRVLPTLASALLEVGGA